MSFSGKIKEELSRHCAKARHCNLAELSAIVEMTGDFRTNDDGRCCLEIRTENLGVARKSFTLLKKTFNIRTDVVIRRNTIKGSSSYHIYARGEELLAVRQAIVQAVCCKRAYIRGAFLAAGSVSDPEKFYHLEIVCATEPKAKQIRSIMATFGIEARIVVRKRHYVVYIKEGNQIVDMLNVMEAHRSLMEFENVRILKEMRGNVNRQVNCETANINKTVSAAISQIEDITYIRDRLGFESLPDGLAQIARARLMKPEATLKELGEDLDPPVGKSGVNHRLRKLSELAGKLRDQGTGNLNGN